MVDPRIVKFGLIVGRVVGRVLGRILLVRWLRWVGLDRLRGRVGRLGRVVGRLIDLVWFGFWGLFSVFVGV